MSISPFEATARVVSELLLQWRKIGPGEISGYNWENALRTAVASAESVLEGDLTAAWATQVYAAELDEILCRRKLSGEDRLFEGRFTSLLFVFPSPEPYRDIPENDLVSKLVSQLETAAPEIKTRNWPAPVISPRQRNPESETRDLAGIAFSGGGIRSATFNLGVIQALSSLGLLRHFQYISTVSGGGYIGTWLLAWMKRGDSSLKPDAKPTASFEAAVQHLNPDVNIRDPQEHLAPLAFLREFSNYLTPRLGFLSGDTWAALSIYIRNTFLNLLILIAFLALVLLVPRYAFWLQKAAGHWLNSGWRLDSFYFIAAWPLALILRNVRGFSCRQAVEDAQATSIFWFGPRFWRTKFPFIVNSLPSWLQGSVRWLESSAAPLGQPRNAVFTFILMPVCLASVLGIGHIWRIRNAIEHPLPKTELMELPLVPIATLLIALIPFGLIFESIRRKWSRRKNLSIGIAGALISLAIGYALQGAAISLLDTLPYWTWFTAAVAPILWFSGWVGGYWECARHSSRLPGKDKLSGYFYFFGLALFLLILSTFAAFTSCLFVRLMAFAFRAWETKPWLVGLWGMPMMVAQLSLVVYLHVGLMGRDFPDARREWISRFAGALNVVAVAWISLFGIALYGPLLIELLPAQLHARGVLAALWTAVTGLTVGAARSPQTGDGTEGKSKLSLTSILSMIGPYIFVAGLLIILSYGLNFALAGHGAVHVETIYRYAGGERIWELSAICLAVVIVLSLTVDVNEFSMHHFYRNRLVRCYLGASNYKRAPNGFTGFDERDDIPLARFAPSQTKPGWRPYLGPYPIINTSLNMTAGERLAYQERKASSFIFTPRYCGVDSEALSRQMKSASEPAPAYRPTLQYAYPEPGIHIGTAMAISGAAASPNEGFHSSPAPAFLMTVFNVRLGWWVGNPHREDKWTKSSPWQGLFYLLKELFGSSSDRSGYVYLSDGGHFDNMGLYELVKRKCRFIVLCDAEEDPAFAFEGLGNAMRKIRADLGVEIEIDVDQIRPKEGKVSAWHCVVGKIHYENLEVLDRYPVGTLLYLKSSLTGNEPSDILQYSLAHGEFPHQSTVDQFFDESQFESYRRLGYHVATSAFQKAVRDAKAVAWKTGVDTQSSAVVKTVDVFHSLNLLWFPPSASTQKSFTRHVEKLNELHDRLRTDPNLRFLDRQFFIEWNHLAKFGKGFVDEATAVPVAIDPQSKNEASAPLDPLWMPQRAEEIQAGFYFCSMLIHLMEGVYLDLDLEEYSEHPDNQGWMNLFHRCAEAGMFRVTWSTTAATHGFRFRAFCERELGLQLGTIEICSIADLYLTPYERDRVEEIQSKPAYREVPVLGLRLSSRSIDLKSAAESFALPFGMLVLRQEANGELSQIAYMRVRRHLRRIGLGGRTIQKLMQSGNLDPGSPVVSETEMPRRVRDRRLRQFNRLISQAKQTNVS